jgi:alkanesulfonate monooxygenase SsuD/methylene tetrahydromethanopterin reductase-like flavin-dependent oxidoreductase (luciferase family)
MQFGIFDHLDRGDAPLAQFYEDRLQLIEAADRAGIASYHLAEHHWNPVGMAPLPGVFLGAVAMRTKRIKFGPLSYAVTFHDPLILAEEIAMLDQMSGGRFLLGVGRGISVWELAMFGYTQPETRDMFREAMDLMLAYFSSDMITHRGRRWRYFDVPVEIKPLQKPHPPLWYGSSSGASRDYVAGLGMAMVAGWSPSAVIKREVDAYRAAWTKAGHGREPILGSVRHLVIAEDGAEAAEIAKTAYVRWQDNLEFQARKFGFQHTHLAVDYEQALRGSLIAGTPAEVRAALERHIAESGVNYVLLQLAFGNLSHAQSLRTLDLFVREVQPALTKVPA